MNRSAVTTLLEQAELHARWIEEEGGVLLSCRPDRPIWMYVVVCIPLVALDAFRLSDFIAFNDVLAFKAREFAQATSDAPDLAFDSRWAGWIDADGATFRVSLHEAAVIGHYGIPFRSWVEAWEARERQRREATA